MYLGQSCVQHKVLYTVVGAALIIFGMKFIGHDEPLKLIQAPLNAAKTVGKTGAKAAAA